MTRGQSKLLFLIGLSILIFIIICGCYFSQRSRNTITIGTKNFTEQNILAYLVSDMVEYNTDYNVRIKSGLGETSFLQGAILHDDIDMYADYSSTAYLDVLGQQYTGQSSDEVNLYIKEQYNQQFDLDWLFMFGFDNSNAFICTSYCTENNITSLSQLASQDDFTFAAPANFYARSDGYSLLEDTYGFAIPVNNQYKMDSSLIYSAVSSGQVDVGLAFTTDGRLQTDDYVILTDDKQAFPIYDAGLVVANETKEEYPGLVESIMPLANTISNEDMQMMNYQVDELHQNPQDVADQYLQDQGLIA